MKNINIVKTSLLSLLILSFISSNANAMSISNIKMGTIIDKVVSLFTDAPTNGCIKGSTLNAITSTTQVASQNTLNTITTNTQTVVVSEYQIPQ